MRDLDDLKSFAGKACVDIYNDFSEIEVRGMPQSLQKAWEIGRDLINIANEEQMK